MPLAIGLEPMVPAGSIGENGMDLIRHGFEHVLQEFPNRLAVGLVDERGHGKRARAVDADEHKQLALNVCTSAMSIGIEPVSAIGSRTLARADRLAFELRPLRLVALHVSQAQDAVAL